jgi:trehalose synthase
VGADEVNGHVEDAWSFLRSYLEPADAFVFSRRTHVHAWMPVPKVSIIPPSIDPLSPKNQPLDHDVVRAILGRIGFLDEVAGAAPVFRRRDGSPSAVSRRAAFPRRGEVPPAEDIPLVVQVSRWDRLKDMVGVLRAFADHVAPPVHLALVGPSVQGVADDPEGAAVLAECVALYDRMPGPVRARVHLVSLPVDDPDENAAMVNAFQRHATVVVQKSLQEGFGLTVTEAMIKSKPLVASRVGGIQDQVRHEHEGLLVDDPADLGAFPASVNRLLDDVGLASRLGGAARMRAVEGFVGDRHLAQYADLLVGLVARRAPLRRRTLLP